jgi:hypothetical protein
MPLEVTAGRWVMENDNEIDEKSEYEIVVFKLQQSVKPIIYIHLSGHVIKVKILKYERELLGHSSISVSKWKSCCILSLHFRNPLACLRSSPPPITTPKSKTTEKKSNLSTNKSKI